MSFVRRTFFFWELFFKTDGIVADVSFIFWQIVNMDRWNLHWQTLGRWLQYDYWNWSIWYVIFHESKYDKQNSSTNSSTNSSHHGVSHVVFCPMDGAKHKHPRHHEHLVLESPSGQSVQVDVTYFGSCHGQNDEFLYAKNDEFLMPYAMLSVFFFEPETKLKLRLDPCHIVIHVPRSFCTDIPI